jgi:hypothetical protein
MEISAEIKGAVQIEERDAIYKYINSDNQKYRK